MQIQVVDCNYSGRFNAAYIHAVEPFEISSHNASLPTKVANIGQIAFYKYRTNCINLYNLISYRTNCINFANLTLWLVYIFCTWYFSDTHEPSAEECDMIVSEIDRSSEDTRRRKQVLFFNQVYFYLNNSFLADKCI